MVVFGAEISTAAARAGKHILPSLRYGLGGESALSAGRAVAAQKE